MPSVSDAGTADFGARETRTANFIPDTPQLGVDHQLSADVSPPLPSFFTGTDAYVGGQEGYPIYRTPVLATVRSGMLLAFATALLDIGDQSQNKLVLKRSADLGKTWQPLHI